MALDELTKFFPNLAAGWNPTLPPRAMDPDNGLPVLYVDSMNYVVRDGRLQRRPGVAPLAAGFQFLPWIAGDGTEVVMWCGTIDTNTDYTTIAVTNYRIMVKYKKAAAWKDCTPTYSAGTVTVTNGSTLVTGLGTQWSTLRIGAFSKITISGVDYLVTSVTSDTTLNIVSGYAGTTGGGKAYAITRFFGNVSAQSQVFACLFNYNLYVAGDYCGGSGNAGTDPQPAVVKVANFETASPTTTYITARDVISTGLDACGVSNISGIQALQDGRIVISGSQSFIYYSSLLNDAVWTSSPGGFTQITLIPGRINALGRIGNNLTLHHDAGIVYGYPTGQSDPPLGYQASEAREGCFAPSTLRADGTTEYFVTSSGCVKQFDGARVQEIGSELRPSFRSTAKSELAIMVGGLDQDRGDYYIAYNASGLSYTSIWKYSISSRVWSPLRVGLRVRAFSDGVHALDFNSSVRFFLGLGYILGDASMTSYLASFDESVTVDSGRSSIEFFTGGISFTTDDIDFGDARRLKTIRRVIIWVENPSSETIVFQASGDNGATWTPAFLTYSTSSKEKVLQCSFDEIAIGASTQWRFNFNVGGVAEGNSTTLRPLRMLVIANSTGAIDGVSL